MAYLEIVRFEDPETLYCATFFLGKAGNVVPGGHCPTVGEAMHGLAHVLEGRDLRKWAPTIEALTPGVEEFMRTNPTLTWSRFEASDTPTHQAGPAIHGMTAGCSVRRNEEYVK